MNLLLFMNEDGFQRVVSKTGVFLCIVKWISCSATKGHFLCTIYPLSTLNDLTSFKTFKEIVGISQHQSFMGLYELFLT